MDSWSKKIKALRQAFAEREFWKLKEHSTEWIQEAAASNNPTIAKLAVLAYASYKMQSKAHIVQNPKWKNARAEFLQAMDRAEQWLRRNNLQSFHQSLQSAEQVLIQLDQQIGNYSQTTVKKAKIKMASNAYAFGMSIAQSSALTGADSDDVQAYIGITRMHDETPIFRGIADRVRKMEEALK
ncbi:MAG: hypothetical protein V1847_02405 [Candidatus Diapherotrites archaeon]